MPSPRPHLLAHLVARAAERDPDHPALVGPDETLDRQTLADRVARLGSVLTDRGVRPGDRVVVFATKSVESYVAMHAALHAGAIASPVDPLAPATVLADVVRELTPAAAVVDAGTARRWPPTTPVRALVGGDGPAALGWEEIADSEPRAPVERLGSDVAYLITTSGSTGRPKVIAHTHASGLRYAELAADCYGLGPADRMASVAPFHFDQSTFELYAGPLAGAATILVPDPLLRFPASVSELLERERVTTWYSVPTILRQLLERGALERRDLRQLRWVLFGGEVFPPAALARLMALVPAARFSNVYGPAEVNQCAHHHLEGPPPTDEPVPIGRAWPDTELRLVDAAGVTLTGPGRGELLARTATAMAGYWGRPDLAERAFLVEPGDGDLPQRWYRTGDLVDRDAAGLLHFVGRLDRQVKVRGVRVELEAVEAVLGSLPGVTGSAAVVIDQPEATLVGLIESAVATDEHEVRRALRAALPPGAVPDRIQVVTSLPRTTSGKVDVTRARDLLADVVRA